MTSKPFIPLETRPINPETLKFVGKLTERDYHEELASGETAIFASSGQSHATGSGGCIVQRFETREPDSRRE